MIEYIKNRLKEAGTYRSIGALLETMAFNLPESNFRYIIFISSSFLLTLGILLPEASKSISKNIFSNTQQQEKSNE